MNSYHIFYFPFKWELKDTEFPDFSQSIDLTNIRPNAYSQWVNNLDHQGKEAELLYDEKNYYYKFVHPAMYDTGKPDTLIKHFERKEPQSDSNPCTYTIKVKKDDKILEYRLKLDSINLNFYSTGVGVLSFYLANAAYKEFADILNINQYGRRVFPPFYEDIEIRKQIALSIQIEGLTGLCERYSEDFLNYNPQMDWHPAKFIGNLIEDLQADLKIIPIIDDRMFVNCWYQDKDLASTFHYNEKDPCNDNEQMQDRKAQKFIESSDWYRYLYVDAGDTPTCRNLKMRKNLVESTTYLRWQEDGSLYGATRYSFMLLTAPGFYSANILSVHMKTTYSRMIELVLVQRASMLKFSEEVTRVSHLKGKDEVLIAQRIGSLYKEYIRFMNQIYFKEITTQDQGAELYNLLLKQFESDKQAKDLDEEIGELHGYISLMIDNSRNIKANRLNIIAAVFVTPTLLSSLFGMNPFEAAFDPTRYLWQLGIIISATIFTILILKQKLWIR